MLAAQPPTFCLDRVPAGLSGNDRAFRYFERQRNRRQRFFE